MASIFEIDLDGEIYEIEADSPEDAAGKFQSISSQIKPNVPVEKNLSQRLADRAGNVKNMLVNPEGNLYNKNAPLAQKIYQYPLNAGFVGLGEGLGAVGDIVGTGIGKAAGYASKIIPMGTRQAISEGAANVAEKTGLGNVISDYQNKEGAFRNLNLSDEDKKGMQAVGYLGNILTSVPVGKVAAPVVGATREAVGSGIESAGKSIIKGELKIPKPITKKTGLPVNEARNKIVNTLSKYNLESATGNFDDLAQRADDLFSAKSKQADDLIDNFVAKNPDKTIDSPDIFSSMENEIINGASTIELGKEKQALKSLQNIFNSAVDLGYTGETGQIPLTALVKLKRKLNEGNKLFKRGVQNIDVDPVDTQVRENLYMKIVDIIDDPKSGVPEAAALNREARDIKFVKDAADEASGRIASQNKGLFGSLPDIGLSSAGIAGVFSNPEHALPILAATGAAILARRAGGQGKAAAAIMKTGKAIRGTTNRRQQLGFRINKKNKLVPLGSK